MASTSSGRAFAWTPGKWLLSKALPKIYGDKLTAEVTGKDGGPIETIYTPVEVARRLALHLGRHAGGGGGREGSDAALVGPPRCVRLMPGILAERVAP